MKASKQATLVAGRYRMLEEVGRGGMASVFRAVDTATQKQVALKLLRQDAIQREGALERIRREGDLLRSLDHASIVKVDTYGALEDGQIFVVMELLEGATLAQVIRDRGPMTLEAVVEWFSQVAEALSYAHDHGVIHRDLKPDNIFLTADGGVKVLDFGISVISGLDRLTSTGEILGTPTYMAPEQLRGERHLDARTDVYALAVVLHTALAGRPPFEADTLTALVVAILNGKSTPLARFRADLPTAVGDVVVAGMAVDSAQRPASVRELAAALEEAARELPAASGSPRGMATSALGTMEESPGGNGSGRPVAATVHAAPSQPPLPQMAGDIRPVPQRREAAAVGPPPSAIDPVSLADAPRDLPPSLNEPVPAARPKDTRQHETLSLPLVSRRLWIGLAGAVLAVISGLVVVGLLTFAKNRGGERASVAAMQEQAGDPVASPEPILPEPQVAPEPEASEPIGSGSTDREEETVIEAVPEKQGARRPRQRRVVGSRLRAQKAPPPRLPAAPDPTRSETAPSDTASASPVSLLRQARAALRAGDAATCLEVADRAVAAGAGLAGLRLQGDCHLRAGHAAQALGAYERFCRLARDHPAIDEVRGLVRNLGGQCP